MASMTSDATPPETAQQRRSPSWLPTWLRSRNRLALTGMLLGAVAWAFIWGAHEHGAPVAQADLSAAAVSQSYVIDASTGTLDLAGISLAPGEVVEFILEGSAGAPHTFVLSGATPGSEMDQLVAANGDTIIRLRVPTEGGLSFICTIPGHEGLHGNLIVSSGQ